MPRSLIACRVSSYGHYQSLAYEHLAGLGIRHVEIVAPSTDNIDACASELRRFGLMASTIHADCDPTREDVVTQVRAQLPVFKTLDCKLMFVAAKAGQTDLGTVYQRLRALGDEVARYGITIVLETHPDLVTNADVALATMAGVDHPDVRVNFDTANIHFYNHNIDGVKELQRVVQYVRAVHLKDTSGGFRDWHFPALGRGVVDFRGTFAVLDAAGFDGPCTLEIEGIEGEERTERLVLDRIAESVGYLRGLGRM